MPLLLKLFEAERTSDIGNRRQVVAITGAGSGIGRATALLLAEQGAKLVFDARRADRLEAVTAEIGPISLLDDLRVDDWDEMIDVNIERVLYGIATAFACIPEAVFRSVRRYCVDGRIDHEAHHGGLLRSKIRPAPDFGRPAAGSRRQAAHDDHHAPGVVHTEFAVSKTDPDVRAQIICTKEKMASPPGPLLASSRRDQAAIGCRCGRDRGSAHGAE